MSRAEWGFDGPTEYVRKRRPPNTEHHYDRWTPVQVADLRRRKAQRETNSQIASTMGRTPKAIKTRWELR